jgi:hypothetical protein
MDASVAVATFQVKTAPPNRTSPPVAAPVTGAMRALVCVDHPRHQTFTDNAVDSTAATTTSNQNRRQHTRTRQPSSNPLAAAT